MNWTMPYPWRSRSDSVRRINMSSEPGNESFFCALRPIPRILSLRRRDYASQVQIGGPLFFRQRPGEQYASAAGENVLPAVEFIGDRRALHVLALPGMPERLAVAGAQRKHAALAVAGEDQAGIGGEYARACAVRAQLMSPFDLAGLVVDGFQDAFSPDAVVGAGPSESAIG